jgi:hypothetical protein
VLAVSNSSSESAVLMLGMKVLGMFCQPIGQLQHVHASPPGRVLAQLGSTALSTAVTLSAVNRLDCLMY